MEALRTVNRLDVRSRDLEGAPQSGVQIVQRGAHRLGRDGGLLEAHTIEALGQIEHCRVAALPDVEQQRRRLYAHLLGHGRTADERSIRGGARCGQRLKRGHGMTAYDLGLGPQGLSREGHAHHRQLGVGSAVRQRQVRHVNGTLMKDEASGEVQIMWTNPVIARDQPTRGR